MKQSLYKTFQGLDDPMRLKILELLGSCSRGVTVSVIARLLKISLALASHHLRSLETKDLVTSRKCGRNVLYYPHPTKLTEIITYLFSLQGIEYDDESPERND